MAEMKVKSKNHNGANNSIFDVIWGLKSEPTAEESNPEKPVKYRKTNFQIVSEYAEFSTVAGMPFLFIRDQVLILDLSFGKTFFRHIFDLDLWTKFHTKAKDKNVSDNYGQNSEIIYVHCIKK
jgi:hypothetical protein